MDVLELVSEDHECSVSLASFHTASDDLNEPFSDTALYLNESTAPSDGSYLRRELGKPVESTEGYHVTARESEIFSMRSEDSEETGRNVCTLATNDSQSFLKNGGACNLTPIGHLGNIGTLTRECLSKMDSNKQISIGEGGDDDNRLFSEVDSVSSKGDDSNSTCIASRFSQGSKTVSLSLSSSSSSSSAPLNEMQVTTPPSASSSGYGGSREGSPQEADKAGLITAEQDKMTTDQDEAGLITAEMKAVEEKLRERESREGSLEKEVSELSRMKEYQRYLRLQHLLQKSSIYSKFLLQRMEAQIEKRKKKEPVKGGGEKGLDAEGSEVSVGSSGSVRTRSRGKKRKNDNNYQLSDYMDSKGKLKKMKLDKGEEETFIQPCFSSSSSSSSSRKPATSKRERFFNGVPIPCGQPELMTGGVMRSYQVEGMEWIKVLYENGINGILADEMGLGKTLQVIGVIAHLIQMQVKGPFLVAAPLSTLPNWVSEFNRFTPRIPVMLYHGTQMEREKLRRKFFRVKRKKGELDTLPVMVTSYEICMKDQRYLMNRSWKFLVVDEGHRIKNLNCKLIRSLKSYDAANRLLLTGTPLQNNLAELWSLLNFILPDIFDDLNGFQSWFDFDVSGVEDKARIIAQEREQHVLSTLHQILTPFLLRRLKSDVELTLPPKKEVLVYAPLTAFQEKYYTSILDRTIMEMVKKHRQQSLPGGVKCEGASGEMGDVECEGGVVTRKRVSRRSTSGYADLNDAQFEAILSGKSSLDELVQPNNPNPQKEEPQIRKSAVNIKLTNAWMMLRKCCNHPYLLEFPMTDDGKFQIDEELITASGKTMLLDRLLPALISRGHKTIVFSQFTSMLDILEDFLELRNITYGRLDGQMPFTERQRQISVFQGDPQCVVFLLSTRAGGLGVNLTAADTVIIYDSDWNPQSDLQAQDRCHRIGQTKPVMIYRLVTANTIDQRIVERATSKRRLEKMVIHKGKFKGYSGEEQQLSLQDLISLLQSVDHQKVVSSDTSSNVVISDSALQALLDRTAQCMAAAAPSVGQESTGSHDTGGNEAEGEECQRLHSDVFRVVEQDSSGSGLDKMASSHS